MEVFQPISTQPLPFMTARISLEILNFVSRPEQSLHPQCPWARLYTFQLTSWFFQTTLGGTDSWRYLLVVSKHTTGWSGGWFEPVLQKNCVEILCLFLDVPHNKRWRESPQELLVITVDMEVSLTKANVLSKVLFHSKVGASKLGRVS